MNLQQALAQIGVENLPGAEDAIRSFGKLTVTPFTPRVDEKGRVFVICGGSVLFGTAPTGVFTTLAFYIVHDTDEERRWYARAVRLTSGNRRTDIRAGILFVNPQGATRDPHRGWEALVHDLSHEFARVVHGGEHARLEIRMIKEVRKRGWLTGTLLDAPKPATVPADPRNVKRARTVAAIARWEAKERRATNALRKLRRSLAAQDRATTRSNI